MKSKDHPSQVTPDSGIPYLRIFVVLILLALIASLTACQNANEIPVQPDFQQEISSQTPEDTSETELESIDETFIIIEEIIFGLLFIATLVGIVAHRFRIPYTIGLVLMGLVLTFYGQLEINIPPNLILAVLVPPLIFEAAFHLNLSELRQNIAPILALAIPGVLITTFLVGWIVSQGTGLALPVSLVFGAIVAATDPVSVVALFRRIGVHKRLQVLIEGESLFNDGTAIVVFQITVAAALAASGGFNLATGLIQFVTVSGGGLLIGLLLGMIFSQLISRIDDYLIETTLTSVLAFGSYLIAEILGMSGVLAVVAAGLVNGNIGPRGMSPTTRIVVFNFWEYAAFLANSFVFLLIGLRVELSLLFANWQWIAWAIGGVLIARAVAVYGLYRVGPKISLQWQHVLFWGGLRGEICLALALSLPLEIREVQNQLLAMAFGVVLFSLLVQGLSMNVLVKRLGLIQRDELREEYDRRHARAVASRAAYEHLQRKNLQGLISDHTWSLLAEPLQEHSQALVESVRDIIKQQPSVEVEELITARKEYLRAQRSMYASLLRDGVISNENYAQLVADIDAALTIQESHWPELLLESRYLQNNINRLVAVIVQEADAEDATNSLIKLGISVTRLSSYGGYLGSRNATLLIGLSEQQFEIMMKALKRSCRKRFEFTTLPLHGSMHPITTPMPIPVGGATIFAFEVERYEEF
jgi:CPA1 family monovalent cation:H+ antiporter